MGAMLLVALIGAGLYFFTDTGRQFVDRAFDRGLADSRTTPVTLMPPFKSYMSVASVSNYLDEKAIPFSVTEHHVPKVKDVPAKRLHTIRTGSFEHYSVPGELTLEFFNDRLFEVAFSPYQVKAYADIARKQLGLRPDPRKNGRSESIHGNKRITSNVFFALTKVGQTLKTKPYVIWQDLHLLRLRRR